jgi:hypothetical protein
MRLFGKPARESGRHFFNTMRLAMQQLLHDHARQAKGNGTFQSPAPVSNTLAFS